MASVETQRTDKAAQKGLKPNEKPVKAVGTPTGTNRIVQRARGFGASVSNLARSTFRPAADTNKEVRTDILKINNQLILTQKILKSNQQEIMDLAKSGDVQAQQLLESMNDAGFEQVKEIQEALLRGEDISADQSKKLIMSLEGVTKNLGDSQIELNANFNDITSSFKDLITNEDLSREDRRTMIKELVSIGKSSDVQTQLNAGQKEAVERLAIMSEKGLNFNDKEQKKLDTLLNFLSSQRLNDVKLRGTLDQLNNQMDSAILTDEELQRKLEEDKGGKSLRDRLESSGVTGGAKAVGAGLTDFILSQVGLGGLGVGDLLVGGSLLGGAKGVAKKAVGGVGKAAGGIARGAKGVAGIAGKAAGAGAGLLRGAGGLLKGGARVLGKIALPLAAIISIFDFAEGFSNAAEIAGLKPGEVADLTTKFQAGVSSVLSGLTFGLVESKDIFEGIDEGMDFLFGKDGVLVLSNESIDAIITGVGGSVDFVMNKLKGGMDFLFGEEGILPKVGRALVDILALTPIGLVINNFDKIKDGFMSLFGEDGLIAKFGAFLIDLPAKVLEGVTEIFTNPASIVEKVSSGFASISAFMFDPSDGLFSPSAMLKRLKSVAKSILPDFLVTKFFGEDTAEEAAQAEAEAKASQVITGAVAQPQAPVQTVKAELVAVPVQEDSNAKNLAIEQAKEDRVLREKAAEVRPIPPLIVPSPDAAKPNNQTPTRKTSIDDVTLAVMNAGMAGI